MPEDTTPISARPPSEKFSGGTARNLYPVRMHAAWLALAGPNSQISLMITPITTPIPPGFRSSLVDYIRAQAQPPEKFSHQERLYQLTTRIGAGLTYDDDVVFAAAWLHDLGVFVGHRPEDPELLAQWDHVVYVLERAPGVLAELGFPITKTPAVLEAILTHQPKDDPCSIEGVILRDADILEQLGAAGILRTVCKIGRDTRFRTFADALRVLERNLHTLPGLLRLDTTRAMATSHVECLRAFIEQAHVEAGSVAW